jgi:hypothetical protein
MLSSLLDASTSTAIPTSEKQLNALIFYQLVKVSSIGLSYNVTWAWDEDLARSQVWAT